MAQSESDPFLKFGNMLMSAKAVYVEGQNKIVDDRQADGKMHCVALFTRTSLVVSKTDKILWMFSNLDRFLKRLGFDKKQLRKEFRCTEPDCFYYSNIFSIADHLHVAHKIAVKECGRIVLALKDDSRPVPKGWYYTKLRWLRTFRKINYFIRN